jgi:hypothetical protein
MEQSTKHEKARELAPKRIDALVKKSRLLCNLGNTNNYHLTDEEKRQILNVVDAEAKLVHDALNGGSVSAGGFTFSDDTDDTDDTDE